MERGEKGGDGGERENLTQKRKAASVFWRLQEPPNAAKEGCQLLYTLFLGSTEILGHDFIFKSAFL